MEILHGSSVIVDCDVVIIEIYFRILCSHILAVDFCGVPVKTCKINLLVDIVVSVCNGFQLFMNRLKLV